MPTALSRDELFELVWSEPMTKVAPRLGLSDVGLGKVCKRYDIPRPPVGYWALKAVGRALARPPLPPTNDAKQIITFHAEEKAQPVEAVASQAHRVSDEELKRLIEFEEQDENRLQVGEPPSRFHPVVRDTKAGLKEKSFDRYGLMHPSWSAERACLSIYVAKESVSRALCFMDHLVRACEARGHQVRVEPLEHRKEVIFVVLGEKFSFSLREKTKRTFVSAAERKKSYYSSQYEYRPSGEFELQLHRRQTGFAEATWKDGKKIRIEEKLNAILIELIVSVEKERKWRKQREESERRAREEQVLRWRQEEERRKEEQKIQQLTQMVSNWEQAARVRSFLAAVRDRTELNQGPIEDGSELAKWLEWASKYANQIDPLAPVSGEPDGRPVDGETHPRQPR
jgi:hypothetical protein